MSKDPTPPSIHLNETAPASMTGDSNLAGFVYASNGVVADVLYQAMDEAFYKCDLYSPLCTDNTLRYIGKEKALPRYAGESATSHRNRLKDAWPTWQAAGTDGSIIDQGAIMGFSIDIEFDIGPGGEIYDAGNPNAQRHIRRYPVTSTSWYAQFVVVVNITTSIGTGAVPWTDPDVAYTGSASALISQDQLDTIRAIVQLFKPVGWLCREIIVSASGTSTSFGWDAPIGWDNATSGWDDSSSGAANETFPASNVTAIRWTVQH